MRRLLFLVVSLLSLHAFARAASGATPPKPNLIWIMADDLGYAELGSYGQKVIQTPQLDRMAREGMRFTHFYAGATICAPSRSVLMTGQHHGRTRVRGNAALRNARAQALRAEDVTVARALKDAGYTTALIGKWGLGDIGEADSGLPRKQGFDYFFGYLDQRHAHNHFPDFLWRNEEKISLPNKVTTAAGPYGGGYATEARVFADDLFADEALKFVAQHREKPYFLYWSMVIPHANNERTTDLKNGAHVPDFGPYAREDWPDPDKGQAAMITRMDSYVGRMMEQLKALGLADHTLVIFTSDNGPHDESNHNLARFQPAGPFSGIKRDLTDGGIRVPFLAWWPGKVKPGTESKHVGYFGDWFATALELAGGTTPPNLDSVSLVPTLLGRPNQPKHEFLYWEHGFNRQGVLYQGRWKGLRVGARGPIALHDLHNDVAEKNNVAAQHPDIVGKIETYLKTARSESDWDYGTQPVATEAQLKAARAARVAAWEARIPERLRARMNEPTMGSALAFVEDDPRLPRVLLIGDSISIGYTGDVRERLRGKANVHRVPDNASSTRHGVASIDAWLGTGRWDVIHFNWGLHDLVVKRDGEHAVTPEKYRNNLDALIERMKNTGATLIFATTTAVPEGEQGRRAGSEALYNPVAVEVMTRHGVTINDLDAAIRPHLLEYQAKNDVHFGVPGSQFLAGKVTEAIQRALASRATARR
ncbi:MAG: hypothetical protein EXS37_14600 [Opitutus sp.]|nr:hypothetical protein [Opitutus sp.]